ncbi:MAG: hypothetical protein LBM67_07240, partial [Lentimicrobiaceae bacterium]|nr:hypothetical protein [Lentimicrobiaceae bacterium]
MAQFPFKITSSPLDKSDRPSNFLAEGETMNIYVRDQNKPKIERVERFFQKWKQFPEVWNWYYLTLMKHERYVEAERLLDQTLEQFPDYIFAKCEKA